LEEVEAAKNVGNPARRRPFTRPPHARQQAVLLPVDYRDNQDIDKKEEFRP
jgi:hypothetical protein